MSSGEIFQAVSQLRVSSKIFDSKAKRMANIHSTVASVNTRTMQVCRDIHICAGSVLTSFFFSVKAEQLNFTACISFILVVRHDRQVEVVGVVLQPRVRTYVR